MARLWPRRRPRGRGDLPRLRQRPVDALHGVELTVVRRLDGLLHGDYQGILPGPGSEPGDARAYEPGDDVRRIDWPVTARTGALHLRERIADHDLQVVLVLDLSASMDLGSARSAKRDLAVQTASALGLLSARGANATGALVLSGDRRDWLPPRAGRAALAALVHRVAGLDAGAGPTDLAGGLRVLAGLTRRRSLVVLLSDFCGDVDWGRALRATALQHDVMAVEILDERDVDLPDVGFVALTDPETGATTRVDTARPEVRAAYAAAAAAHRRTVAGAIRAAGASHVTLRTDRDWVGDLARSLAARRSQRLVGGSRPAATAAAGLVPAASGAFR